MQYRTMGKLGVRTSAFGLGCMRFNGEAKGDGTIDEEKAVALIRQAIDGGVTYLDTAYVYLNKTSETVVGKALQDGYREKVTVATKMPLGFVKDRESMEALLDEELRKLQTDHIDFYLMHGIDRNEWEKFKAIGAPKFFDDMKREGKIRFKCFSFHGPYEDFAYILNDYDWDMVQIQYNFMDVENQAGTRGLKLAAEKGIPVVVMEGLLGGRLSHAPENVQALYDAFPVKRSPVEWAFRWLCSHPEVSVVLSGCNEPAQVEENLRIFDGAAPGCMDDAELQLMDNVRAAYLDRTKIGCTGCKYCMPCPNGVEIPGIFSAWNNVSLYCTDPAKDRRLQRIRENGAGADSCIGYGACEAACPQHLPIVRRLRQAWDELFRTDCPVTDG
ncbi:MAG: aldo/keto reductase [Clostridia bacterium]|nr:aldo/keto reductase [Clostridia bacterium]